MYKIYINDLPLIIAHPENAESFSELAIVTPFIGRSKILLNYIDLLEKQKRDHGGIVLTAEDTDAAFASFSRLFIQLEAAGGLIKNPENKYLFIYRRGKWDLPKGKIDEGESASEAALREISEEVGLDNLEIGDKICTTFHTYRTKEGRILKPTHWFNMECKESDVELSLEEEEDIMDARWLSREDFLENYEQKTYNSIVDVVKS